MRVTLLFLFVTFFFVACAGIFEVTLYFDSNGGSPVNSISTDGRSVIVIPDDPVKEGFVFYGWYWDNGTYNRPFTANSLVNEPISENMTVYAQWISQDIIDSHFSVSFQNTGDSTIPTQTIKFGETVQSPENPVRLGYLFQGWYKDVGLNIPWNFSTDIIKGETIIYGKWSAAPADYYIVNFVSNSEVSVPSQQVYKGTGLATPTVTKSGYRLDGWYTSLDGGQTLDEKWSFTSNVVNSNFTLYARWIINEYTISFQSNGGSSVSSITHDFGAAVTQPSNPTKSGYVFGGWYTDNQFETVFVFSSMPAQNVTVYAKWMRTIVFETNGGGTISSIIQSPGSNLVEPTQPTRTGYTFGGWYQNPGLTTTFSFDTMPDTNLTIYVKWNINQYSISFESNGGSTVNTITQAYDTVVTQPNSPIRTGYTFRGWYIDAEFTNIYTFGRIPANDIVLYAKWQINQYTIDFSVNGGSSVLPITVNYNDSVTEPSLPTKEGHAFSGWYADATFTTSYVFTTMPAQNTTVFVKWTVNQYVIDFVSNGGSPVEQLTIDYGTVIDLGSDPVLDTFSFAGWYIDAELTVLFTLTVMPASNITLYAKWLKSISFNSNGGSPVNPILEESGNPIDEPTSPVLLGYTFSGWYTDTELLNAYEFTTMPADNLVLYAKWVINQYTITLDSAGGSLIEPITQDFGSSVTPPSNPTKNGYTFDGWYIDTERTQVYLFSTMPANDMILYAKWVVNQYTINFEPNEGSVVNPLTANYNAPIVQPTNPTRTFYSFGGWYSDMQLTNAYSFVTMPWENITLYAKWIPNNFTITFNLNGGTGSTSLTFAYLGSIGEPIPAKTGYTFDGWYTESGLTNRYTFTTMPPQNFTLYAKWTINSYTISFDTHGGNTMSSVIKLYNSTIPAISDPVKDGFTFAGWYIDETFVTKFTYLNMPANDITLHAKWENTITFNSNGGSAVASITKPAGTSISQPSNPTKEGHTFNGWYSDSELTQPYTFSTMPSLNTIVYAKWTVKQYVFGFEVNGGSYVETIIQNYGTTIVEPTPTRTGHTFSGWFVDSGLLNKYTFTTMPANNMVLYAKWTINQYTITFETNGGTIINPITQNYNTTVNQPADPDKEGHTFGGWYSDIECEVAYVFSTMTASNITLYSKWNVNTYTINYLMTNESVVEIGSGYQFTIALTSSGNIFAWGNGSDGQLGTGNTISIASPRDITAFFNLLAGEKIIHIAVGYDYAIAVSSGGRIFCWGDGYYGQLGSGYTENLSPFEFSANFNLEVTEVIINVQIFGRVSYALSSLGRVFVWGYGYTWFPQYDATQPSTIFNSQVSSVYENIGTSVSEKFGFIIDENNRIYAWGYNLYGQLGDGTRTNKDRNSPIDITNQFQLLENETIMQLHVGSSSTIAFTSFGRVFSWGRSNFGQLGSGQIGTGVYSAVPIELLFVDHYTIMSQFTSDFGSTVESWHPINNGYTMDGWYSDVTLLTAYEFGTMPANNLTLYAKWVVNQYTINFEANGGNGVTSITADFGSTVAKPADPTNTFYSFGGWYSDTELTQLYTFTTMPARNFTLYAKWIPNDYTISFNLNGGSGSPSLSYPYLSSITEPTPTKEGHTFEGWYTDSGLTSPFTFTTMPPQNFTLYAKWSINFYTLSFNTHGGNEISSIVKVYGTTIPTITPPIKEGFTFAGWYLEENYVTQFTYLTMPASNLTLYAKWENTITFNSNGGTSIPSITKPSGATVTAPTNPTKVGHTFSGWYADVELTQVYSFSTMPDVNTTVYAKWTVNQYIIGFEANGGSYTENITQNYGSTIIEPIPTKTGYTFNSWYRDSGFTQPFAFTTMPAENFILYAKWTINQYTISFESNGGAEVSSITQNYNTTVTEPEEPTRTGYTFEGWYVDEAYVQAFAFTSMPAENITLQAKWRINSYSVDYYVKYDYYTLLDISLLPSETIIQVELGAEHSAVLTSSGRLFVWGRNNYGQLGDGTTTNKLTPTEITSRFDLSSGDKIVLISLGYYQSAALTLSGRLFTWGNNSAGQLGDGTTNSKATPTEITNGFNLASGDKIISISLGGEHSVALTSSGSLFTWGSDSYGQLGDDTTNTYKSSPTEITHQFSLGSGDKIIAISLGNKHSAALTSSGRLFTWGDNERGKLGNDLSISISIPKEITYLFSLPSEDKIISISLGFGHSAALTSSGRLYTWGDNYWGVLGIGSWDLNTHSRPIEITSNFSLVSGDQIISISLGRGHNSAYTSSGRLYTWGGNGAGQLGDGTTTNRYTPIEITSNFSLATGEKIMLISLGGDHNAALTSSGRLLTWGPNGTGQLGDGTTINRYTPTEITQPNMEFEIISSDSVVYNQIVAGYFPTIEGYTFDGWYTDTTLTQPYTFTTMPANDMTLYAKWVLN